MIRLFRKLTAAMAQGERYAWLATALVVLLFVIEFSQPIVQADDAFISYRYALNLAHGNGLVFNPGEYVEGFTNLLWTLLIAAFIKLGVHAPAAGQAMSLVFGAASLVLLHIYVRRLLPSRFAWAAAAAPACMLATNSFACWMSTGLETPMVLCLTIAALLAYDSGRSMALAWICVLALLCRPEGGLLAAVLLGAPWLQTIRRFPRGPANILAATTPLLIFGTAVLALTGWRLYYYGDFVPNTFHAKVGQAAIGLGWIYLEKFLCDGALLLVPGAVIATAQEPRLRIPMLFVLATTAYVISIGGDVFAYGRFLLPTLPVLLAGALVAAANLWPRARLAAAALALALPATALINLYVIVPLPFAAGFGEFGNAASLPWPLSGKRIEAERHYFYLRDEKKVVRDLTAKMLAAKPGAKLIACIGIGKMGYYNMNFVILDMVGLTDRHVAESQRRISNTFIVPGHSRTDSDYILSRKPDVIILPNITAAGPNRLPAEVDMLHNPGLPLDYRFVANGGFWVRK